MEPKRGLVLRRAGRNAVAERRRPDHDGGSRLQPRTANGGSVAGPQPRTGRVRRGEHGTGRGHDNRAVPLARVPRERPRIGLGHEWLRHRSTAANARKRRRHPKRPDDGDGRGRDARRTPARARIRRTPPRVQGRRPVGRDIDHGERGTGRKPGGRESDGNAGAERHRGFAAADDHRPDSAHPERGDRLPPRRRRRRDRNRHGHRRRLRAGRHGKRPVGSSASTDAGSPPGRRV